MGEKMRIKVLVALAALLAGAPTTQAVSEPSDSLATPESFASIADEQLVHHIGTDTLVGWAWAPGFGRKPAPGTQQEAGALADAWVKTGAVCPN